MCSGHTEGPLGGWGCFPPWPWGSCGTSTSASRSGGQRPGSSGPSGLDAGELLELVVGFLLAGPLGQEHEGQAGPSTPVLEMTGPGRAPTTAHADLPPPHFPL